MRITTRMTTALALAGSLLFGTYGLYLVHVERGDLRESVVREVRLVGNSLRVSVENALRDRQLEDIEESMFQLEYLDPSVDVYLFGVDRSLRQSTSARAGTPPWMDTLITEALAADKPIVRFEPEDDARRVVFVCRLLSDDKQPMGALALSRPLDDLRSDLAATSGGIALSVGLFVLTASLLGLVLGSAYIGHPLQRMTAAMRRVREGDLASGLDIRRRDEIGNVAQEFNEMVRELRDTRRHLREEAERRRELVQALQRADKLATIGQLSASVAHEIGSPLQVLQGRARSLALRPGDAERTRRNAEILVRETERISRIVERMLSLTRRQPPTVGPTDLCEVVQQVVELLDVEAKRCHVGLRLETGGDLPAIPADGDRIQQVVLNLLTNAIHASHAHSDVEIELRAAAAPGGAAMGLELVVQDHGAGMTAEIRDRVFEPFFTTRAAEGGTGLGLAVVRALVMEHGGEIGVESEVGRGSRFSVWLPLEGSGDRDTEDDDPSLTGTEAGSSNDDGSTGGPG